MFELQTKPCHVREECCRHLKLTGPVLFSPYLAPGNLAQSASTSVISSQANLVNMARFVSVELRKPRPPSCFNVHKVSQLTKWMLHLVAIEPQTQVRMDWSNSLCSRKGNANTRNQKIVSQRYCLILSLYEKWYAFLLCFRVKSYGYCLVVLQQFANLLRLLMPNPINVMWNYFMHSYKTLNRIMYIRLYKE